MLLILPNAKNSNRAEAWDREEIETLMDLAAMGRKEFAKSLGVTRMTLNRWLRGETRPEPHNQARMREMRRARMAKWFGEDEADELERKWSRGGGGGSEATGTDG